MLLTAHLHRGVGSLVGGGAWREGQLREEPVRREGHAGDGPGGEIRRRGYQDLLDLGVGGPDPVGSERRHWDDDDDDVFLLMGAWQLLLVLWIGCSGVDYGFLGLAVII